MRKDGKETMIHVRFSFMSKFNLRVSFANNIPVELVPSSKLQFYLHTKIYLTVDLQGFISVSLLLQVKCYCYVIFLQNIVSD